MYKNLSVKKIEFKTFDYIVYAVVALLFGLGTGSYYGLLAFVPLVFIKFFVFIFIDPKKVKGSGLFVSVTWKRFMPKGFGANLPKEMMTEFNRLPNDRYFIVPYIYLKIALYFIEYQNKKQAKKSNVTNQFSKSQIDMAQGLFDDLIKNLKKIQKGQTEKKSLPFGILTVERM